MNQLIKYISQQLESGVSYETIRHTLLQNNWNEALIVQAFSIVHNSVTPVTTSGHVTASISHRKNNTKVGVLWILSPVIVLIGSLFMNIIVRLIGISSPVFNVVSLLAGVTGVVLVVVGPVVGALKLANNKA